MITPEQLAAGGNEQSHQKALFCWAALNFNKYPVLKFMYHVPNGGFRNVREAANLKASGVRAGVPDLHLPVKCGQYSGLFIELKIGKGKASPEQEIWKAYLNEAGYYATVCHGYLEAVSVIEHYLKMEK